MTPWFDEQTAGMVGGAIGAGIGTVFGGIGGGVGGPLAAMGRGKAFVLGMFYFALVFGLCLAGVGVYAAAVGQPLWVWVCFVLPGVLTLAVMGPLLPVVKARYREAEQRRLDAQEFAG